VFESPLRFVRLQHSHWLWAEGF